MTSDVPPTAAAPAWAPFQEYSLKEWSSSVPTSVTKPTFHFPAAEPEGAVDGADDVAADGAVDVPAEGADVAPELLHAANATDATASSASAARDDEMRMILLRVPRRVLIPCPRPVRVDRRLEGRTLARIVCRSGTQDDAAQRRCARPLRT